MANDNSTQGQLSLITKGITAASGVESIRDLLQSGKQIKCFWATAPTGKPHIAYLVPFLKLVEFVEAGVEVEVLLCGSSIPLATNYMISFTDIEGTTTDLYAYLNNYNVPFEIVKQRAKYYQTTIKAALQVLGCPDDGVRFVLASTYEFGQDFVMDNYRLSTLVDEQDIRDTGGDCTTGTKLSVLMCPNLPALAEEYLKCDVQFGGEDQLGLFEFNERFLPQLGYRKRAHLMNPMVLGLKGSKMSASIPDSKIDLFDDPSVIRHKIFNACCLDGHVNENGLLDLLKHVVMPIRQHNARRVGTHDAGVKVSLRTGAYKLYEGYEELETDFGANVISALALKQAVSDYVCEILEPLRKLYDENAEWRNLEALAYPNL
ncbi:tyrosyl-tRNA synthetase [Hypoxylon argillaceum]|nr:tyrosyl-tRNA synthetase [Hypoxylon argillaceum]